MADTPRNQDRAPDRKPFGEEVNRKAARKRHARQTGPRSAWFGLGMFGLVGWSVAIPTLLGIALGLWMDSRWPAGRTSWTLTLLIIGVALGCLNAWYWVKQESGRD
ncbi:MAG: AtpZ/AtpI family protein [Gammaproteobacteria bacterium]